MPNFDNWFTINKLARPDAVDRAMAAWDRILDKPSVIRKVGTVSDITVRLEYDSSGSESRGENASPSRRGLVIFSVQDHPTVADFALGNGDRFFVVSSSVVAAGEAIYEIVDVIGTHGEIQATAYRIDT